MQNNAKNRKPMTWAFVELSPSFGLEKRSKGPDFRAQASPGGQP